MDRATATEAGQAIPLDRESLVAHLDPAFVDERGEITNIIDGLEVKHIALITSKKGTRRGDHVHLFQSQWIYVIQGRMVSWSCEVPVERRTTKVHSLVAVAGDLLFCPPRVAHAYAFLEDTVFLNIDDDLRNPTTYAQDTIAYKVPA